MKNIFDIEADLKVIPVNCVGVMGKGLAKEFKERHPELFKQYKNTKMEIGKCLIFDNHIINNYVLFPTKLHWKDPSKLEWITAGLIDLYNQVMFRFFTEYEVNSIAFPRIGCGLGGLDWNTVKPLIETFFNERSKINIIYCEE